MPKSKLIEQFSKAVEIVATLRGPQGCPWDKDQTLKSLVPFMLEEAFELAEAIDSQDKTNQVEELGDFLFQALLQAQVAQDEGLFTLEEVLEILNKKLIRRHPHVFGDEVVSGQKEILERWEQIKSAENKNKKENKPFFSLPKDLPALMSAQKIGEKSKRAQFDWAFVDEVLLKVDEELGEVKEELAKEDKCLDSLEHEIGDLLFSVTQLARHLNIDAESSLRKANHRFINRFEKMRDLSGLDLETFLKLPAADKEIWYVQAKKELNKK